MCNCYAAPARLFIFGVGEILSNKGTTHDDPTSMGAYALDILPMLYSLLDFVLTNEDQTKEAAFAFDLAIVGKLADITNFWDRLATIGPKYGYFPKATKSYLIVKSRCLKDAKAMMTDTNIKITNKGRKHLDSVVGSDTYKVQYVQYLGDLFKDWNT